MTNQEKYKLLDNLNLCHRCKKNEQFPNRKFCPECLEKITLNNIKQKGKGSKSPEKIREYQKKRREKHISEGLCVRCNKPATHGLYCYEDSIYVRRHDIERNQRRKQQRHKRGLIPEYRKEHNLCCFCGQPIDTTKHGRACSKCAVRIGAYGNREILRKSIKRIFQEDKK